MKLRAVILIFSICFLPYGINAQQNTQDSVNRKALRNILISESVAYSASMLALGTLWYDDLNSNFSFFNDNDQWAGLDKLGHGFAAYQITKLNAGLLSKAGLSKKKAYINSALISTGVMLSIEIFDGFSSDYGASYGDMLANTAGAFLPLQELIWDQVYIHPKFSFHATNYASQRPEVLGSNLSEQWLKDYNGQTYWLSTNFNLFSKNNIFPNWLAFSVGYGAENMLYGSREENKFNGYNTMRSLYLSLDLDLSKFEVKPKWLKVVLYGLNMVKIPLPTLQLNKDGATFHPIYF